MRKIADIRKDLSRKVAEVKALENTPENADAITKGIGDIKALERELEAANVIEAAEQRAAENNLDRLQRKEGRPFSIIRFINGIIAKNLTGLEAEVADMGRDEYRRLGLTPKGYVIPSAMLRSAGQNYTTAVDGGNLKEEGGHIYTDMLRQKIVLASLGANVLTDLIGTVPVIGSSSVESAWVGEGVQNAIKKAEYKRVNLTPHRSSITMVTTSDLLVQTSFDVERDLMDKIADAHATLLEKAAICGTGADGQPLGILNTTGIGSVAMGTNGAALTWPKVVELETAINSENANRGKLAYLANAKVWGAMKTIEKATGSGRFIYDDLVPGRVNGYKIDWSNLVPSDLTKGTGTALSALIFGNFSDLYIGQWGGLDFIVDPYTGARTGEIYITLNAWNDVAVAEPKSFAAIKDIKTA